MPKAFSLLISVFSYMSASTSFERSSLYTIHSSLFDAHRIDRYRRNTFDEEDCQLSVLVTACKGTSVYMTSAVGGGRGVPKKQMNGTKSADL